MSGVRFAGRQVWRARSDVTTDRFVITSDTVATTDRDSKVSEPASQQPNLSCLLIGIRDLRTRH